jgi:hypothetical protein
MEGPQHLALPTNERSQVHSSDEKGREGYEEKLRSFGGFAAPDECRQPETDELEVGPELVNYIDLFAARSWPA